MAGPATRYRAQELITFATALLVQAGMDTTVAHDVAAVLVEGDLLGHDTHGLQLLAPYLAELEAQRMTPSGIPRILNERPVAANWDGQRLPGPYLVRRAIDWAAPRAAQYGSASVTIRRSHHIACLAAYLEPVARAGLLIQLTCCDPAAASVAPFGGARAVFTPNPIAFGIPTSTEPILIDVSASITTNGMSRRMHAAGERGTHPWWLDADGRPTDDPGVIFGQPAGTILPLGGLEAGHKGYGLALAIEALSSGLAGHGRANPSEGWGASVFLQIHDPESFGGLDAFCRELDHIAAACHASPARDPACPVRLPGERALAHKREQLAKGVALHAGIMDALMPWAQRLGVTPPAAWMFLTSTPDSP